MARVNYVKKSRKAQPNCGKCGAELPVGSAYKWVQPRYQGIRTRCMSCPSWRPSELTSSSQLSTIYGAQEAWDNDLGQGFASLEDAASSLRSAAEEIRSAGEAYEESASNMEDGFGHETMMSEELKEKGESVVSWADEIEQAADQLEGEEVTEVCTVCSEDEEYELHDHVFEAEAEGDKCSVCASVEDEHHGFDGEADESELQSLIESAGDVLANSPI